MGATVCGAVSSDPALELVAAIDPAHAGETVEGISIVADPSALDGDLDVVIDFTHLDAARGNVLWAAEHGAHAVVGTTGFDASDLDRFRGAFTKSNCVIAPNFAIGAVLMIALSERAAPYFETAEVVEMHHDAKRDSPSGTAMFTAERIAAASSDWAPDPTELTVIDGSRGGVGAGGIHVHALRVRGMVASQEVIFGTTGQSLTIRHDTYDRASFMPGVLLAAKAVADKPGVTVGLDQLLDL
jgi:4-hydroxy-tetrahydrodipicolinate reductase